MSIALAFARYLQPVTAAPGRPDGAARGVVAAADGAGGDSTARILLAPGGAGGPTGAARIGHPAIPTDREAFVAAYAGVVEHSPWVAEAAFDDGPFRDATALHAAFERTLLAAPRGAQVAVLRAHPELAAARAVDPASLTAESASEQAGAGLDRLAEDRRLALAAALTQYRERFDFPFVACVRDHGGTTLDDLVASRLAADPDAELAVAVGEVSRIARHRLVDLVEGR